MEENFLCLGGGDSQSMAEVLPSIVNLVLFWFILLNSSIIIYFFVRIFFLKRAGSPFDSLKKKLRISSGICLVAFFIMLLIIFARQSITNSLYPILDNICDRN